ncbi:RNA polymerase sigma factor RpoE [Labilithrix luteola]|uniref:RNA polymerase sigma factor RpoE n=1 Tax=Labilithrix luteola TaxID=1391654 RepID=A0A0K1PQ36_9BACT|nr:RNA polymerase sigma factor [Labilithrix luteola]AKU95643.1 RNA polymerase sigma factor RpoE [Labilithrix luteola]
MVAVPGIVSPASADADASLKRDRSADERLRRIALEHYDFAWRSLRRLGIAPPETDDATQQVFIILSRKLDQIEPGKERTFVFGIAVRVAANVRRAHAKRREVPEVEAPASPFVVPAAEARLDRVEARTALDEIIASMSEERREVFILSALEELSTSEIAAVLQLPLSTVVSRLRRAREDLRAGIARLRARRQGV